MQPVTHHLYNLVSDNVLDQLQNFFAWIYDVSKYEHL